MQQRCRGQLDGTLFFCRFHEICHVAVSDIGKKQAGLMQLRCCGQLDGTKDVTMRDLTPLPFFDPVAVL